MMFRSKILVTVAAVAIQSLHQGLDVRHDINRREAGGDTYSGATSSGGAAKSQELTQQERTQYERVLAYLGKADLLRFVNGVIAPHGSGASFHVTFTFVNDDQSKTDTLAILRNTKIFNIGPLGSAHAKDVGATVRADAYDFRSRNDVLGPRSLEVMINYKNLWGYADIDRYDLYGGFVPASAHIILEFLPDKVRRTLFRGKDQ